MVLKNNIYSIIINQIINHNYTEVLYVGTRAEGVDCAHVYRISDIRHRISCEDKIS